PAQEHTLLRGRELEHVTYQQTSVIACVVPQAGRQLSAEYPAVVLAVEQPRRHGSSRNNKLWVCNPTLGPGGTQPVLGEQEVGRGSVLIVTRISGGMTLKARRCRAGEEFARHGDFGGR